MKNFNKILLFFMFVAFSAMTYAQTNLTGTVTGKEDGTALPGVTVVAKGTTIGTITDLNGKYEINVPAGTQFLTFSYLGMETQDVPVSGTVIDVQMYTVSEELVEIYIIADRAKERETPVAFSDVTKEEIQQRLGSRDVPLVMNMTPGVYATAGGGGAGDARINVRGFNQRNVAIMLNGVPVNDMENGWVYWSNWDGIGDAASSFQMQRGLSAINLATPSIGGTMNIITSPADKKAGGSTKLEYGSGNFMKMTLSGNTGLINDRFALSFAVVGKQGNGVIDQTWTKAAAYYLGTSFKVNDKHKLELFALGAPQKHGQNLYKQNIAAYGHDIAKDFGADDSTLLKFPEANPDTLYPGFEDAKGMRFYNENWGPVTDYSDKQWWNGKEHERNTDNFMNERENYFHKPLVNFNWYATWSDKIKQYTTIYYSGGKGGGSGTYGSMVWNYNSPSRFIDFDGTIERNVDNGAALGILRNSVNNQWTIGAISRAVISISDNLKAQVGVDWRTASIDHFYEIRDLLGGTYFHNEANEFESGAEFDKGLGDKIYYFNTNTVDWFGYFVQAEYSTQKLTAYATFGNSYIDYSYTDHFAKSEADTTKELFVEAKGISGYQIKGGFSYRPVGGFSVFANYGYISKVPIFDNVIDDASGTLADDPKNEIFNAIEAGISYQTPTRNLDIKANYYYTKWTDRAISRFIQTESGNDALLFLTGMDQLHSGFEFEAKYKPIKYIELVAVASLGNWTYTDDVTGSYKEFDNDGNEVTQEYNYYIADLKVGDMPQTQFGGALVLKPINGLRIQFDGKYNAKHYADFDPTSRTDEDDKAQVWETPSYFIADLHLSYELPLKGTFGVEIFGHVFNLLDEIYIQDAADNSRYNSFKGYDNRFSHTVNAAEVYLGLPRTFNAGVKITF